MTLGGAPNIPKVQDADETEDNFFNMVGGGSADVHKNAFAVRAGSEYVTPQRYTRTDTITSQQNNQERRITKTVDLDNINDAIEAKAIQLQERMKEVMLAK